MRRSLVFPVTLTLLLLCLSSLYVPAATEGSVFCDTKCKMRCAKAGIMDRCLKYCGVCCSRCNCVPSGTYGNKDECPCYRDMTSSKHKPKCP